MQDAQLKSNIDSRPQRMLWDISPGQMALLLTLFIFIAEIAIMIVIDRLPPLSPLLMALVDATLLVAIMVPLYVALYRPFWKTRQVSEEKIRQLNNRLTEVSEEERRRIALDLHDHCDQTLVALHKTVELVQSKVIDRDEEAAVLCQEIGELLGRLNHDVRAVSSFLHPPQLADNGIGPALAQYVKQMGEAFGAVALEFVEQGDARPISRQMAISIYRITQEAVKNALQHSGAELVRVYLEYSPDKVAVSIVDDGCGFDPRADVDADALGLVSMRERAAAIDGSLSIHSEKGRGTSLRASFKV
ncbi:MAG: hypothetical protein C0615_09355 [Desulfuromonas sp.]|nr:MAG: hypothetical protein C0615_09355 [Desulfuromonas sp.]